MDKPKYDDAEKERLNKVLAFEMGFSRREADEAIQAGNISINGETASLGARISPDDEVRINGKELSRETAHTTIVFHKPVGYVCSRKAQGDNPTIYELLPNSLHALKTVGRLDKDSSGILLLTNDGDLAFQMTHPRFHKTKTYEVQLDRELEPLHQQMISDHGITLEDGVSQLILERVSDVNRTNWKVLMHEGRNRQIRRTFAALGYEVISLHRTQFGNYALNDLASGSYLTETTH